MVVYYRDGRYYDRYVRGWPVMREVVVYERNGRFYHEWDDDATGTTAIDGDRAATTTIATGTTDLTGAFRRADHPDPGRLHGQISPRTAGMPVILALVLWITATPALGSASGKRRIRLTCLVSCLVRGSRSPPAWRLS